MVDPRLLRLKTEESDHSGFWRLWWTTKYVETGSLTERIAKEAGVAVTKELQCIVANLVLAATARVREGRELSVVVSRRAATFTRTHPAYLYRTGRMWGPRRKQFVSALDALEEVDVIEQVPGKRREGATEIIPGHTFDEILPDHTPCLEPSADGGVITLKGPKNDQGSRRPIPYDEKRTAGRQERLDRINRHVESFAYEYTPSEPEGGREAGTGVSSSTSSSACSKASSSTSSRASSRGPFAPSPSKRGEGSVQLSKSAVRMSRIFHTGGAVTNGWGHGRFYSLAQNISGRDRRTIRIEGEPTVELDIAATTPTILYHLAGLEAPADAYALPSLGPEYRDLGKAASMVVFNAGSRVKAEWALIKKAEAGVIAFPPGLTARALLDEFEVVHKQIADQFYTEASNYTMLLDSRIAEKVMLSFVGSDVPCLSVHESFIVPERAEERLYHAIVDAYGSVVASNRRPRLKATYADGSTSYVTEDTYRQRARAFR